VLLTVVAWPVYVLAAGSNVASPGGYDLASWPQWRGPNRDGVAPDNPELADAWPKTGPPKVWQSEPLSGGGLAGYSSPVVAGGKVYVYSAGYPRVPIATRTFAEKHLREMGWFSEYEKPPQELLEKIEEARAGNERAAVKGNALNEWITKWTEGNLDEAQRKQFSAIANDRLRRGTNAIEFASLDKLAGIRDREFETKELFEQWLADSGLPAAVKRSSLASTTSRPSSRALSDRSCLGWWARSWARAD
jgi:hypothetical protein